MTIPTPTNEAGSQRLSLCPMRPSTNAPARTIPICKGRRNLGASVVSKLSDYVRLSVKGKCHLSSLPC